MEQFSAATPLDETVLLGLSAESVNPWENRPMGVPNATHQPEKKGWLKFRVLDAAPHRHISGWMRCQSINVSVYLWMVSFPSISAVCSVVTFFFHE